MTNPPYKVVVVLQRDFGERLTELAPGTAVWILDTPINQAVAKRMWKERKGESHLAGITTFKALESLAAEDILLNELEAIDLHHGSYSAEPPYTALEVLGTPLSARIKAHLSEYGFSEFHPSADGFLAVRAAHAG